MDVFLQDTGRLGEIMARLYRSEILENHLRHLVEMMADIRQTVIVSADGFVVAAYPAGGGGLASPSANSPQVAAMAAALMALGDQTLGRLAKGDMRRLMIEGDDGAIIVYPINRLAALAALVNQDAKMGLTLHEVSRVARSLSQILPA